MSLTGKIADIARNREFKVLASALVLVVGVIGGAYLTKKYYLNHPEHLQDEIYIRNFGEGKPAPQFELYGLDGNFYRLDKYHGKPTVIKFFDTRNPTSQMEILELVELARQYENRVTILSITLEAGVDPLQFIAQMKEKGYDITFPILVGNLSYTKNIESMKFQKQSF